MKLNNSIYAIVFLFFFSCSDKDQDNQNTIEQVLKEETMAMTTAPKSLEGDLVSLINSIPPPVEIATLIINQNVNYDNSLLHDSRKVKKYQTTHEQAFYLGMYGTDLGYTHIYNQSADCLVYFDCVNRLAHELKIDSYFDNALIKKITQNDNLDSLLTITTDDFSQINDHFIELNNPHLSVLLISGGWVESIYLLANTYNNKPNTDLKEKIAEQKVPLELLMNIISKHIDNDKAKEIHTAFAPLASAFDKVKIVSKTIENATASPQWHEDGTMTFTPDTESVIQMTEEEFNDIIAAILSVRKKLTI